MGIAKPFFAGLGPALVGRVAGGVSSLTSTAPPPELQAQLAPAVSAPPPAAATAMPELLGHVTAPPVPVTYAAPAPAATVPYTAQQMTWRTIDAQQQAVTTRDRLPALLAICRWTPIALGVGAAAWWIGAALADRSAPAK